MLMQIRRYRLGLVLSLLLTMAGSLFCGPRVSAQEYYHHHHLNFAQRHPVMVSVGAAMVTHHMLKVAAERRKERGERLTWAERHPSLSAIGVGVVTHHVIKSTTPN